MAYSHILRCMPSATLEALYMMLRASLPKDSHIPEFIRKVIIAKAQEVADQRAHAIQLNREITVLHDNGGPYFPFCRLTVSYIGQSSSVSVVSEDGVNPLDTISLDAGYDADLEMPKLFPMDV